LSPIVAFSAAERNPQIADFPKVEMVLTYPDAIGRDGDETAGIPCSRWQRSGVAGGGAGAATLGEASPHCHVADVRRRTAASPYITAFSEGVQELGWIETRDYDTVYRYSGGDATLIRAMSEDLAHLGPSVIVTGSTSAARALKAETSIIPIVCSFLVDPVDIGLAASVARPGGNVTGTLYQVEDLQANQVELILEVIPGIAKVGTLASSSGVSSQPFQRDVEPNIAARLKITTVPVSVAKPKDLETAFDTFARDNVQAVLAYVDPLLFACRVQLADLALKRSVPLMAGQRELVDAGGLFSYGVNGVDNFRRTAAFADKILKGTQPGDIPIEFPTKLEMVINLKTAKALGLTIPPTLLARADEVIE
jgi:putative ABC transport system substrate-binding protein